MVVKGEKIKLTFNVIISLIFVLICLVFFISSTSDFVSVITEYIPINLMSYYWPLLFLLGVAYGVYIILKNNSKNPIYYFLSIIVICLCVPSLGYYSFIYYLVRAMGG